MLLLNDEISTVRTILDDYLQSYANKDMQSLEKLFHPTLHFMLWGTGAEECYLTKQQFLENIEKEWAQLDAIEYDYDVLLENVHDTMGSIAVECTATVKTNGRTQAYPKVRFSLVCAKEQDRWYIVHGHCSVPDPRQQAGEFYAS